MALFLRRALAYFADNTLILIYGGMLGILALALGNPLESMDRPMQYLTILAIFTGPVVVVMSLLESSLGWSPGKRVMGLRVSSRGFIRVIFRNVIKYLPWELAHIGIWIVPGQPFVSPPGSESYSFWYGSLALLGLNGLIVLFSGRGIHDRLAGLSVVRAATRS